MAGKPMAIEELKILQEIIARHEQHEFRVKGWLFAIMAGYTAAVFTQHLNPGLDVFIAVFFLIAGFSLWLAYHRMYVFFAMSRVSLIEEHLRQEATWDYDGPKICESLAYQEKEVQLKTFIKQMGSRDVLSAFCLACFCLLIGMVLAPGAITQPPVEHPSAQCPAAVRCPAAPICALFKLPFPLVTIDLDEQSNVLVVVSGRRSTPSIQQRDDVAPNPPGRP